MIIADEAFKKHKNNKAIIIDALIDIIVKKDFPISNSAYYYHNDDLQEFVISLYVLKLLINDEDSFFNKQEVYIYHVSNKLNDGSIIRELDISQISNINAENEMELIIKLKDLFTNNRYLYNKEDNRLIFDNDFYVDARWLLAYLVMLFDNNNPGEGKKGVAISYTIPSKDIKKCNRIDDLDEFFNGFTYYRIDVEGTEQNRKIRENGILIIKNAANNYFKHLKQFKYGLESEEAYLIFYNLLKNECHKQGLLLEEETKKLSELDESYLDRIKGFINYNFLDFSVNKQTRTIENVIWHLSNYSTILEHINSYIDSVGFLIDLLKRAEKGSTYSDLKWDGKRRDIQILLMLIILKFMIAYIHDEDIDYSLLDFSNIKPEYMNLIDMEEEAQIKNEIIRLKEEIRNKNEELDKYKFERQSISKENLGQDKYHKELELCVSNINRISIDISNLEAGIVSYQKELENVRFEKKVKYRDLDAYNYNHSIIRHMVSSICHSGFYLKTNNNNDLLDNIIIIEDYVKTDNAFYLEISFRDMLRISNINIVEGAEEIMELPKLK